MHAIHRFILVAPLAALAGCGPALEPLRVRASVDMFCSEQALTLTEIQSDAYTVAGCGRSATYVYVGDAWLADLSSFRAPMGSPGFAPPPLPMQPAWIGPPTWPPPPLPPPAAPPPAMPPLQQPPPAAPAPAPPLR